MTFEPLARADQGRRPRQARLHGLERLRRHLVRVEDAAFVEGDPRQGQHAAPLMLDRVIGREHDQPDRRPCCDAGVELEGKLPAIDDKTLVGTRFQHCLAHGSPPSPRAARRPLIMPEIGSTRKGAVPAPAGRRAAAAGRDPVPRGGAAKKSGSQ